MKSGSVHRYVQDDSYVGHRESQQVEASVSASQGWVQAQNAFFQAHRVSVEVERRVQQSMRNIQQSLRKQA